MLDGLLTVLIVIGKAILALVVAVIILVYQCSFHAAASMKTRRIMLCVAATLLLLIQEGMYPIYSGGEFQYLFWGYSGLLILSAEIVFPLGIFIPWGLAAMLTVGYSLLTPSLVWQVVCFLFSFLFLLGLMMTSPSFLARMGYKDVGRLLIGKRGFVMPGEIQPGKTGYVEIDYENWLAEADESQGVLPYGTAVVVVGSRLSKGVSILKVSAEQEEEDEPERIPDGDVPDDKGGASAS